MMKSDDLTHDQAAALSEIYREMQGKLLRALKRMDARGFHHSDPLRMLTQRSFDNMMELRMHAHYLGVRAARKADGWVGPPEGERTN